MRSRSKHRPRANPGAFWTSYADMMAGLMLVFGLIMVFSVYQFSELQKTRYIEISEKENLLIAKQDELTAKQAEIDAANALNQTQRTTNEQQSAKLDASNAALALKLSELAEKDQLLQAAKTLNDQTQLSLSAQQQQLTTQASQLSAQQALMDNQQQRIDALVGVRTRIVQNLSDELRKSNLDVTVDAQTGAITMKGAVLFDVNMADLKYGGMDLLDRFIPVYVRTLLAQGNRDYVAEIIIEGHTDTDGPFLGNLKLSQDRAYAVAAYCLQDSFGGLSTDERDLLRTILTANGRSFSNPKLNADGSVNKEASRRVEFKFRLKEAEMINEMRTIMETQLQATPTAQP